MPGKEAWKRSGGSVSGETVRKAMAQPAEEQPPRRVPGHEIDNTIADFEIQLSEHLTAPLDSVAGEPVSPTGTESIPTPLDALVIDFDVVEEGSVFSGLLFCILFLIVIVCSIMALLFSGAICFVMLGIALAGATWMAFIIGKAYQ